MTVKHLGKASRGSYRPFHQLAVGQDIVNAASSVLPSAFILSIPEAGRLVHADERPGAFAEITSVPDE